MSFLLFLLVTLRYNGMVLIVLISILLYRLLNKKNFLQFLIVFVIILSAYAIVTPIISKDDTHFARDIFSKMYRVNPLAAIYTTNGYNSSSPDQDLNLINKWVPIEELKKHYYPTPDTNSIAFLVGCWNKLDTQDQQRLNRLYFIRCVQNFHIFMGDRLTMLLGTMGFAKSNAVYGNNLQWFDRSFWRPLETYRFTYNPQNIYLSKIENYLLDKALHYPPLRVLIFNTFPCFLLLLVAVFFYKKYPGTAIYSLIFLFNIPFLLIALATCEWRFLYFLLLSVFFVFPLMSVEANSK
jgi:hypothetical protein